MRVAFLAAKGSRSGLWSRDALNRLHSRHDAYPLKLFEHQQIRIPRHDQIGLCGQRTSQHRIIIDIA